MSRLLLVDDDRSLVDVLSMALESAGFEVRVAFDGKEGLAKFEECKPDLVVLDLLMPEIDGLQLCRMIRERSNLPIVMLTSRDEEMDKVLGLEMGADDYITKPFSVRELVARVRAALRRVAFDTGSGTQHAPRVFDTLLIDRDRRFVSVDGVELTLTATEFELLWKLSQHPQRVFSRDQLIDAVYGEGIVVSYRTVDTFVKRLRQKLGASRNWIETVRGVGYRFREKP